MLGRSASIRILIRLSVKVQVGVPSAPSTFEPHEAEAYTTAQCEAQQGVLHKSTQHRLSQNSRSPRIYFVQCCVQNPYCDAVNGQASNSSCLDSYSSHQPRMPIRTMPAKMTSIHIAFTQSWASLLPRHSPHDPISAQQSRFSHQQQAPPCLSHPRLSF